MIKDLLSDNYVRVVLMSILGLFNLYYIENALKCDRKKYGTIILHGVLFLLLFLVFRYY